MQKFTIEVSITASKNVVVYMEPCKEVMSVAKMLSAAYMGSIVSVKMFGQNRRIYEDGLLTYSRPDMELFVSNTSKEDRRAWSCLGQVLK